MKIEEKVKMYQTLLDQVKYSKEIYVEATNSIHTDGMRTVFKTLAEERKEIAISLKEKIILNGGRPDSGLILRTPLHKTWIKVRSAIIEKNVPMIMQDCIDAERVLINTYEDYLKDQELEEDDEKLLKKHIQIFDKLRYKFSEKKSHYSYE